MRGALLFAALMLAAAARAEDGKIEPLEADFLEYLAIMEGDGDDWTLLAEAAHKVEATKDAAAAPRKSTKEAAKPVEEDQ